MYVGKSQSYDAGCLSVFMVLVSTFLSPSGGVNTQSHIRFWFRSSLPVGGELRDVFLTEKLIPLPSHCQVGVLSCLVLF